MLGSSAWALGQAVEILITQTRLVNYTEVWGNWVLAQNFVYGFSVVATLYDNLMPSISEAFSHAYRKLSQYYSVMAYKWGGLVNGFIAASLLAVTPRFILGAAGPEFVRAASLAVPLLLWGAVQYPSWVGDNVQNGSNRPYLKTGLIAAEQVIRIFLAYLLVARFQIYALIVAYFAGLLTKDVVSYFVSDRLCYKQRFYFWQSLGAPLLAGGAHYLIVSWLTGFIWKGDQVTSVLIFLIAILFSFPLYAFLYGLAGGWDDATLDELREAAKLSNFMRPLAWLFWKCNAIGAGISPLHGRFPISIRAEAMQEAALLTAARVKLEEQEMPETAPAGAQVPPVAAPGIPPKTIPLE
jgi:O-antigen/teichoic acid export membrane protein